MKKFIVGLCIVASACVSYAEVLVALDTFESYTTNSSLIGQGSWTAPPGLTTVVQGAWSVAVNSPLGASGSKAANVKDEDTADLRSPQMRSYYNDNTLDVVVRYDFMAPSFTQAPYFALQTASGGKNVFRLSMGASLKSHNGSSWGDALTALAVDTWYTFEATTHLSSHTYDLVVSDSTGVIYTGIGLSLADASVVDTDRVMFSFNSASGSSGGSYYVDNVSVNTIPEPATIGLDGQ